ncbi:MAG: radical SAM protein [Paracoccaceae bacterium]
MTKPPWKKHFSVAEVPFLRHGQVIGDEGVVIDGTTYKQVNVVFEGEHVYLLSQRAILTVTLTPVCNAACGFCYNGITFLPQRRQPLMPMDDAFERVLAFAKAGVLRNISLSGGEPTLNSEQLLHCVRRLRPDFPGFLRVHTNGSRLWDADSSGDLLFERLLSAGVTDVSISRAARLPSDNDRIMRMKSGASLQDDQIATLARAMPDLRLSCFFTADGVSSGARMQEYIEWGQSLGVRRFVFRLNSGIQSRFALPGQFYDGNNDYPGCETRELRDLLHADGFQPGFNRQCEDYDLYELKRDDVHVSVDRSSDVADPDRKIRRLLHMPNGVCYTSWLQSGASLFPEDAHRIALAASQDAKVVPTGGAFPAAMARAPYYRRQSGEDVDLHVHSTLTDGLVPASEMIGRLREAGIGAACFSDHNAVHSKFDLLRSLASQQGLEIPFAATEVSVVYTSPDPDGSVFKCHVLAFGDGIRHPDFQDWMSAANRPRRDHLLTLYNNAVARGVALPPFHRVFRTHDPVDALDEPKQMFTRTPLARAIAEATALSVDQVRAEFLPPISKASNERQPLGMHELLAHARRFGFVTVMAHPGWVRDYSVAGNGSFLGVLEMITKLSAYGLDGVELRHRQNDARQQTSLLNLARSLDLLTTGGSDYHGKPRCSLSAGHRSTRAELARLKDRVSVKELEPA